MVQQSIGDGFTMRITGSDRGPAQGSVQVRLNRDRNEIELINVDGRIGPQQLQRQLQPLNGRKPYRQCRAESMVRMSRRP